MNFSERDFKACMFNPLTKGNLLTEYPRLSEIIVPEWVVPELDSLLRYIICVYDPKSILVSTERDLNYRKGLAAELAGLQVEDEEFITSIYTCTHEFLADLI